jgi:HAD superfamily hydrolase (TIGR01509 family)
LYDSQLQAFAGADAMLAALTPPKCVASNGPRSKIEHGLRNGGLLHHFDDRLYSAYDVGAWKPDPALFLHAARDMGHAPTRCAVIEDSPVGIDAALAAGMAAFWFDPSDGGTDRPGVRRFTSLAQLPALLA